jgi:putative metallohydrolase (TIGR04338 family)
MAYNGPRFGPKRGARDSQRSKVYGAEGAIPTGKRFPDVASMQAYVDKLLASAWARRRWGNRSVTVKPGFGHTRATGGYGDMHMPVWSRTESIVLHELAHNLAGGDAWHDAKFVRVLLELVAHVFGADAGKAFRAACRTQRVRVGPPLPLRSAERTPAAPVKREPKLWRIEFKSKGVLATREVEARTMKGALTTFLMGLTVTDAEGITNLRAWRGVRKSTAKAAAKRKP